MKKIYVPLLLIIGISGIMGKKPVSPEKCVSSTPDKGKSQVAKNERLLVAFNPDSLKSVLSYKSYLKSIFTKEYGDLKESDILSCQLTSSLNVKSVGITSVYKISFSEDLPQVFSKTNYLLLSIEKKKAALFLLDTLICAKTSTTESAVLLGGIEKVKSKGYYVLYDFNGKDRFKEVLNSESVSNEGVPVYNSGIECTSYKPFMLTMKNIDLNNDGILDLNFSGLEAVYCKGFETGYGRNDRNPLELRKVNFSFVLESEKENPYKYQFLGNTSMNYFSQSTRKKKSKQSVSCFGAYSVKSNMKSSIITNKDVSLTGN
jgi:hypothetical protein